MKPTTKDLGYKAGDLFVYTDDEYFKKGTVVVLHSDDGSWCPGFKALHPSEETLGYWAREQDYDCSAVLYTPLDHVFPLTTHIANLLDILEEHNATNPNIP